MASEDDIVTVRIPGRDREAIQRLVDRGAFSNRSDFLRFAIRTALSDYGEPAKGPPRVDLDFEGPELQFPATEPNPRARPRRGGRRMSL